MRNAIRLSYLYRDSGNYKVFGTRLFSNSQQSSELELFQEIEDSLISGLYFYPEQVDIKRFKFHRYASDFSWYEFESLEVLHLSGKRINRLESFQSFIKKLKLGKISVE